ncbi:hypothetical protein R3X25_06690 [Lutibacter sp. TH_r2]|uniref:hypothetical protein n=1 Tax=Lutibacter sp. TH_r2 TaxID=3082083 RepID=UPI002954868D|nr:hypothetical protein [Lutibacter sp. TH_r2]MDV7186964.1 hypothetical protein [Lutibacter sp. TH_r2]
MRKFLYILFFISLISCEKNETNDILPNKDVSITVNLNLPQYTDLQIPSGWAYASGGINGIVIQNTGTGNPNFKAFDRACPNYDCTSAMTFDGSLKLTCPCDDSVYSIIDGSPQTSGNNYFAREYNVSEVGDALIISN